MPNSSGGTPITLACASLRVVTMVTSWVTGSCAGTGGASGKGMAMFMKLVSVQWAQMLRLLGKSALGRTIRIVAHVVLNQAEQSPGGWVFGMTWIKQT